MDDAAAPKTWTFVYTRNKKADYAFVVLPEPFARDTAATSCLIDAFDDGSESIQARKISARGQSWTVFYEQHEASAGTDLVLDQVGRPIIVIEGIVADRPMSIDAAAAAVSDARRRQQSLLRLFWGMPAQGPVLSGAESLGGPAPPPEPPPPLPQPRPSPRRWLERLYLSVILALLILGSVRSWNAAAERRDLQEQVQELCVEAPSRACRDVRQEEKQVPSIFERLYDRIHDALN